jgi:diguanylate cyclase (GGDEF)-like protein
MILGPLSTPFARRLLISIALSLGLVGGAGYLFIVERLRDQLVRESLTAQRAEAEQVRARVSHTERVQFELSRVVTELGARSDVLDVQVLDPEGRRLAGIARARAQDATAKERLRDGRVTARIVPAGGGRPEHIELVAPVAVGLGGYVLIVRRSTAALQAREHAVIQGLLLAAVPGALLVLLFAWVFGGRALAARHEQALMRARTDGLTRLANHRAFRDELARAAAAAQRDGADVALVALDLDEFKYANDRHGHQFGDEQLRRVADALARGARAGDRAFRTGGDEFALLLPRTGESAALAAAARIQRELAEAGVAVSAGIAVSRPGTREPEALRAEADAALYEAKRRAAGRPLAFSDIGTEVPIRRAATSVALRHLLEDARMDVAFQPIWDVAARRLIGVEALARPRAEYGFSGPAEAFAVAEQEGRIADLDALCARATLQRAAALGPDRLLFVNLTPLTLDLRADEPGWLDDALAASGLDAAQVVIEITEQVGGRIPSVIAGAEGLRRRGFRLALDDVGAGETGFVLLRSLDVDFVKLDRGVVQAAGRERRADAVVAAVTAFAEKSGATVIAEGIEDAGTLATLLAVGVPEVGPRMLAAQGYGLGRPQPSLEAAIALPLPAAIAPAPLEAAAS